MSSLARDIGQVMAAEDLTTLSAEAGKRVALHTPCTLQHELAALTGDSPDLIATANVGCQLHLQEVASQPVRHWIELLDPSPAD